MSDILREALQYAIDYGYMQNDEAWKKARVALAQPQNDAEAKPFAWYSAEDPAQPLALSYQKEDMLSKRAERYSTPLYTAPPSPERMREALRPIISALDRATGDTDAPYIETDDDYRDQYPAHWAMQKLNALLQSLPSSQEMTTGQLFNALLSRIDFDGMDPKTFSLAELYGAIEGAEWPNSRAGDNHANDGNVFAHGARENIASIPPDISEPINIRTAFEIEAGRKNHASDGKESEGGPLNWQLSEDVKARIAEIDNNRRNAAINACNIVAGSPSDPTPPKEIEALRKENAAINGELNEWVKHAGPYWQARAETAERERDEAQFGFENELRIKKELADALRKTERERDMLGEVIQDTAHELGCENDNEAILIAIDKLRRELDEARAALKAIYQDLEASLGFRPDRQSARAARAVIKQGE